MIVVQQLSVYRKRLTNEQLDLLLEKTESSKPLFLLTCCEELRCVSLARVQPRSRPMVWCPPCHRVHTPVTLLSLSCHWTFAQLTSPVRVLRLWRGRQDPGAPRGDPRVDGCGVRPSGAVRQQPSQHILGLGGILDTPPPE
jgi:hypothetical protein